MKKNNKKAPEIRFPEFNDDWEQRKLGELMEDGTILEQSDGNHGELYPRSEEFANEGIPYIAASSISSDGESIDFNLTKYLPVERAKQFRKGVAKNGDVLLAHNATVGPSVMLSMDYDFAVLSTSLTLYRLNDKKMSPIFFLQAIRSEYFQKQLEVFMKQTTRSQVPILTQRNLKICYTPNIDEQQKIGDYFRNLDNLITLHQRKCDKIKELKSCMLRKMFPKNGEKRPEIRFPEFTGDWEQRKFSEQYVKVSEKNDLSFGIDKIISVANMYFKEDTKESSDEYMRTYNVMRLGDIAFEGNKSKNYAHGRFVENTIGDGIVSHVFDVFRPIADYDLLFWKYIINNESVMGRIMTRCTKASTMMTNLVANDFLKEKIAVPSLEEQHQIGSFLDRLDHLITLHQRKCDVLKKMKKGMLQKMFV